MSPNIAKIAQELNVKSQQVASAVHLLDEGATVPFIARYRKEATQGLDDGQLRTLSTRLVYLRELDERRETIIKSIKEQEKLTKDLEQTILSVDSKTALEDLYLPFKPKRRTKAQIAREAGLEPLAYALKDSPILVPEDVAKEYINPELNIIDEKSALDGAKQILMEDFSFNAALLNELRTLIWNAGMLSSKSAGDKSKAAKKFADYFNYQEAIKKIPSHRALALFRGRRENFLQLSLDIKDVSTSPVQLIAMAFEIKKESRAADAWLQEVVEWTWKVKLEPKLSLELMNQLRESAEAQAIDVFAENLSDLMLLAPAGPQVTIGLDPGIRTGVKVAVVDITGKLLDTTTIFPLAPHNQWQESVVELAKLSMKYDVKLIAIGNGTGSRETDRLVADLFRTYADLPMKKMLVSEAGASVYSASELAAKEFPELDVSLRGAVSIARRLQDPLAELVKIEAKAIGVGQYQHDVNQIRLARRLDAVVEDCVNAVGVDINSASAALLRHVAGLSESLANNIVAYRDDHGVFKTRRMLMNVPRMGEKSFEQAAGFLRINDGDDPLDASAVHPEAYPLVEKILTKTSKSLIELMGERDLLTSLNASDFSDETFGELTVTDIFAELEKPGRDPRGEFKTAAFKPGVETIDDLVVDMILEGIVSNVANFGAFIDVGVHQDGLVHISEMTYKFIDSPRKLVKAGDIVKVKVIEVDKERRRINLSMKLEAKPHSKSSAKPDKMRIASSTKKPRPQNIKKTPKKVVKKVKESAIFNTAMADALAKLKTANKD